MDPKVYPGTGICSLAGVVMVVGMFFLSFVSVFLVYEIHVQLITLLVYCFYICCVSFFDLLMLILISTLLLLLPSCAFSWSCWYYFCAIYPNFSTLITEKQLKCTNSCNPIENRNYDLNVMKFAFLKIWNTQHVFLTFFYLPKNGSFPHVIFLCVSFGMGSFIYWG